MNVKVRFRICAALFGFCLLTVWAFPVVSYAFDADVAQHRTRALPETVLWYDEPSSQTEMFSFRGIGMSISAEHELWQQNTLPIGNGMIGANIYGEIERERLSFNEKTLWNGGPASGRNYNYGIINGKNTVYNQIRDAFAAGKDATASNLCNQLIGDKFSAGFGSYQPWGDIYLSFAELHNAEVTNYRRDLNLDRGVATVSFESGGNSYQRQYFISYPDNVLVMRLTSDKSMTVGVDFTSKQGGTTVASNNKVILSGNLADNGLAYYSEIAVAKGNTSVADNNLTISGNDILLISSAATDYKNDFPLYRTGETEAELAQRVTNVVSNAAAKEYTALLETHTEDYTSIFDRMAIDLGQTLPAATTDELLKNYRTGKITDGDKRYVEIALFQYGRYLTLASSRETDLLPSNLQGIWNVTKNPPWQSDYHMDVNLQMNYWHTYASNLTECALPLIDFVSGLREPGRLSAEAYLSVASKSGEENGFVAHTQVNPFGWTAPGYQFSWGWCPGAVIWILQNVYEYYEYTQDAEFLQKIIYPMLKEETKMYEKLPVLDEKTGRKLNIPSFSPEYGPRTKGTVYEQTLIWQLYTDAIASAKALGIDSDWVQTLEETCALLKPIEIGESGQIKEWYEETTFGNTANGALANYSKNHRHMSNLLGLFPGDLINIDSDKTWLDAAVVSLDDRGDQGTGWSIAQKINTWARVGDGDRAYKLIQDLMMNGVYPNMLDAHPPYQIDGNFGYTSGVNEMLMQSNLGYINLLPALPSAWQDGSIHGMRARGNFVTDFSWSSGKLTDATIVSEIGGKLTLRYPGLSKASITDKNGKNVAFKILASDKIVIDTQKGNTVCVASIPDVPSKIKDATAYIIDEDTALLTWSGVPTADSYAVYRRTSGGAWQFAGKCISTKFYDTDFAYALRRNIEWAVAAVCEEEESAKEIIAKVHDLKDWTGLVNDNNEEFVYFNSTYLSPVQNWKSQSFPDSYGGDVHWITIDGCVNFTFYGTGFKTYVRKHAMFGVCDVVLDGNLVREGVSGYHNSDVNRGELLEITGLLQGLHTVQLKFYADPNDSEKRKRIDFDAVEIFRGPMEIPQHNLTVDGGSGSGLYEHGASASVTAVDITGRTFVGWRRNGAIVSTEKTYGFQVTRDTTLMAVYEDIVEPEPVKKFRVTVIGGSGGGAFDTGSSVTIKANPAPDGLIFDGWSDGKTIVSIDESYTFTVNANITLRATYKSAPTELTNSGRGCSSSVGNMSLEITLLLLSCAAILGFSKRFNQRT